MDMFVCLSVYLSANKSLELHIRTSPNFLCRGSVLYIGGVAVLFTFSFMYYYLCHIYAMFPMNGSYGGMLRPLLRRR